MANIPQHVKVVTDALSISTVVSALLGWLPAVAALFSIVWTCIRIYETKTVQHLIAKYWGPK